MICVSLSTPQGRVPMYPITAKGKNKYTTHTGTHTYTLDKKEVCGIIKVR